MNSLQVGYSIATAIPAVAFIVAAAFAAKFRGDSLRHENWTAVIRDEWVKAIQECDRLKEEVSEHESRCKELERELEKYAEENHAWNETWDAEFSEACGKAFNASQSVLALYEWLSGLNTEAEQQESE